MNVTAPQRHRIPGTPLRYDDDDVTNGRLSLIVSCDDRASLDAVGRACSDGHCSTRVTDSLDFIRSVVVEVPVNEAGAFVRSLPPATRAWVDATISFDGPPAPAAPHAHKKGGPHGHRQPAVTGESLESISPGPLEGSSITPVGPDPDRAVVHLKQAWDRGFTGKGVNIAVIDSGLYPHPDLADRIVAFEDMTGTGPQMADAVGHGTQVAGCAAGSGARSGGRLKGAAPDAGIVGVRISTVSEAIAGLQWVIDNKDRYGIRVVNLSLGDTALKSYREDPWTMACEKAVQAGLVVVVAAGNEGDQAGSISTPGIDPEVITVGALDTRKTLETTDDTVWESSSRGPTQPDGLSKPDLVAPGVRVFGPLVPNSRKDDPALPHVGRDYVALTGSSQATPLVAGVAALMLQANPSLRQADVKKILASTAQRYLSAPADAQGAGVLDAGAAVDEALRLRSAG